MTFVDEQVAGATNNVLLFSGKSTEQTEYRSKMHGKGKQAGDRSTFKIKQEINAQNISPTAKEHEKTNTKTQNRRTRKESNNPKSKSQDHDSRCSRAAHEL